jgi:hypothetical protein
MSTANNHKSSDPTSQIQPTFRRSAQEVQLKDTDGYYIKKYTWRMGKSLWERTIVSNTLDLPAKWPDVNEVSSAWNSASCSTAAAAGKRHVTRARACGMMTGG